MVVIMAITTTAATTMAMMMTIIIASDTADHADAGVVGDMRRDPNDQLVTNSDGAGATMVHAIQRGRRDFGRRNMPRYQTQNSASDRWWDQYNLGRMGVSTGGIANQLGIEHRRPQAWENPTRVIVPPPAAAPVQLAPSAMTEDDRKVLRYVGNGLLYFFGLGVLAEILQGIITNPFCLSFAVIGGAIALYRRYRR